MQINRGKKTKATRKNLHGIAGNVGTQSSPQCCQSFFPDNHTIRSNGRRVPQRDARACSLKSDLYQVGGIGHGDANGSRSEPRCHLDGDAIFSTSRFDDKAFDTVVQADTEAAIDDLALYSWGDALVQSQRAFFFGDGDARVEKTLVVGV